MSKSGEPKAFVLAMAVWELDSAQTAQVTASLWSVVTIQD